MEKSIPTNLMVIYFSIYLGITINIMITIIVIKLYLWSMYPLCLMDYKLFNWFPQSQPNNKSSIFISHCVWLESEPRPTISWSITPMGLTIVHRISFPINLSLSTKFFVVRKCSRWRKFPARRMLSEACPSDYFHSHGGTPNSWMV